MIKTIIFDFYGVFQNDLYLQWLHANGLTRTGEYDILVSRLDHGKIDRTQFIKQLSLLMGRIVDYDEVYGGPQVFDGAVVKLVSQLHQYYKIGLLSNASVHLREKLEFGKIADFFDEIVISSEVGMAKPDARIFAFALEKLSASPGTTLMIDDNPAYVQAAKEAGMQAIQFVSAKQLENDLINLGIR